MADLVGKQARSAGQAGASVEAQRAPGKSTLVESTYGHGAAPLQLKGSDARAGAAPLQLKGSDARAGAPNELAAGVTGPAGPLPYARSMQPLFGPRDPSGAGAHPAGAAGDATTGNPLEFLGTSLDHKVPQGAEAPAYGEDPGSQRRYSVDQYIEMWEKEQGRKMHVYERATVEQGCIGITLNNLQARGRDPLSLAEGTYGTFEQAHAEITKRNEFLDQLQASRQFWSRMIASMIARSRYVLFAQLFWSNQSDLVKARKKPDPTAYLPDPKTGKIDMSSYKYLPRITDDVQDEEYMNFDFGFWDEATQSFWHANHMRNKDPAADAGDPMKVLQSSKEKYLAGYIEFDRVVFCIARAANYDPRLAVAAHRKGRR